MATKKKADYDKQLLFVMVVLLLVLVILIITPIVTGLLGGIILAYLFNPVYKALNKKIKHKTTSALLTTILIILLLTIPLGFLSNSVIKESATLVEYSRDLGNSEVFASCSSNESIKCQVIGILQGVTTDSKFSEYFKIFSTQLSLLAGKLIANFLATVPWKFLILFVVFFSTFIFLKDGPEIFEKVKRVIPLSHEHKNHFVKRFKEVTHAVVYGTIVVALVQSVLATIGFLIFGVRTPLFWGVIVFIVSILPFVAPPLVYVPISLVKIINGWILSNSGGVVQGVLILLWGTAIVSIVDNLLRYKITGSKGNVHPLVVLVGILGGIKLMGIVGLFYGPLVLVFALTFLEIFIQK